MIKHQFTTRGYSKLRISTASPAAKFRGNAPNELVPSDCITGAFYQKEQENSESFLWSLLNEKFFENYTVDDNGHSHTEHLSVGLNWLHLASFTKHAGAGTDVNVQNELGQIVIPAPFECIQMIYFHQAIAPTENVEWKFAAYNDPFNYTRTVTDSLSSIGGAASYEKKQPLDMSSFPVDADGYRRIFYKMKNSSTADLFHIMLPLVHNVTNEAL